MQGIIFDTERWSLSDGPGTRTVVFLKGCPLTCAWCANPESQKSQPQIGIFTIKCIQCTKCSDACDIDLARPAKQGGFAAEGSCHLCGKCVEACPSRSRRWMGESLNPNDLVDEIKKDMIFYRKSGGGVTFSGGEPLMQPDFLKEILSGCKKVNIHTAVETCGVFNWQAAESCIKLLDFVMFDLKHMNEEEHRKLTGATNGLVLDNGKKFAQLGIPMLIRIPIIPTVNDSRENIEATALFVRDHLPNAVGIEVLAYHRLGLTKYAALGLEYKLRDIATPDENHMESIQSLIEGLGVTCITPDSNYQNEPVKPTLQRVN